MTMGGLARLMVVDFIILVIWTTLVGALAPRWPERWLARDRWPLRLYWWEDPSAYRTLRVPWLRDHLPEAGALFGGDSKKTLPGTDRNSLQAYLLEVRRAEWVHWLSCLGVIPIALISPPIVTAFWIVFAVSINGLFIMVLRHNRLRLTRILERAWNTA